MLFDYHEQEEPVSIGSHILCYVIAVPLSYCAILFAVFAVFWVARFLDQGLFAQIGRKYDLIVSFVVTLVSAGISGPLIGAIIPRRYIRYVKWSWIPLAAIVTLLAVEQAFHEGFGSVVSHIVSPPPSELIGIQFFFFFAATAVMYSFFAVLGRRLRERKRDIRY